LITPVSDIQRRGQNRVVGYDPFPDMDTDRAAQAAVRGSALERRSGSTRHPEYAVERRPDKGVLTLDHKGCVVWWNRGAERILGSGPGALQSRWWLLLLGQAKAPRVGRTGHSRPRRRAVSTRRMAGGGELMGHASGRASPSGRFGIRRQGGAASWRLSTTLPRGDAARTSCTSPWRSREPSWPARLRAQCSSSSRVEPG